MSFKCFLLLVGNLKLESKPIGARLINRTGFPFAYLELSALLITSKSKSKQLFNEELTPPSPAIMIYN